MGSTLVNWGGEVKLTWVKDTKPPQPSELITSVHGFCFQENKLLLVNLNHRGWDFPGGHIEVGESSEECFCREAMEEGYVEGDSEILGYIIVDHCNNVNWSEESKYPKLGYQLFYKMNITKVYLFEGNFESSQRIFISPSNVSQLYNGWNNLYQEILECAIRQT